MIAPRIARLFAVAACTALPALAYATDFIVPTQMPLSVALATAVSGDTIIILPTGSPYTQFPGFSFANKRLTIRGSTGNPADVILDGSNLDRVLSISGAGSDGTVIEGLTIQNGRGPATTDASGAGIYIVDANVIVRDCIVRNNRVPATDGNGAGLYATTSTLTLTSVRFEANSIGVDGDGAALYLNASPTIVEDCVFDANIAEATLTNQSSGGGAVWVDNASVGFRRCTFTSNQGEIGGAVYATTASITAFDACRIEGNTARYGAGLFVSSVATSSIIRNCLILDNHAAVDDCAVRADKPTTMVNCTISGNSANGNYIIGSAATDRRVVIVDNCIIWANTAAGGIAPITLPTNAPVIRRCLLQSAYTVANGSGPNTVADPLFVNAASGDFHIQPSSPAIDAGDTALYFGPLADHDVNPRGVDVPSVANTGLAIFGPVIDIGAYEVQIQATPSCYANCDQSSAPPILNVNDFVCFLNKYSQGCP